MQERAKRWIPGMTQLLSKRPDMFSLGVWPGYYSRAKGARVWDLDGNEYIDMSISGIGACVLGYADPDVDDAVKLGLLQLLTLWPFPRGPVEDALTGRQAAVVPELNMGQMRREVLRVNNGRTRVLSLSKMNGLMIRPDEILARFREVR